MQIIFLDDSLHAYLFEHKSELENRLILITDNRNLKVTSVTEW